MLPCSGIHATYRPSSVARESEFKSEDPEFRTVAGEGDETGGVFPFHKVKSFCAELFVPYPNVCAR